MRGKVNTRCRFPSEKENRIPFMRAHLFPGPDLRMKAKDTQGHACRTWPYAWVNFHLGVRPVAPGFPNAFQADFADNSPFCCQDFSLDSSSKRSSQRARSRFWGLIGQTRAPLARSAATPSAPEVDCSLRRLHCNFRKHPLRKEHTHKMKILHFSQPLLIAEILYVGSSTL